MSTSPLRRSSNSGTDRRYMAPVEWPTNTVPGSASAASSKTDGHRRNGSPSTRFEPSPGKSTNQERPGRATVRTSSSRLSEPIPGPPGRNSQLSVPGFSSRGRRRTIDAVKNSDRSVIFTLPIKDLEPPEFGPDPPLDSAKDPNAPLSTPCCRRAAAFGQSSLRLWGGSMVVLSR